MDIEQTYTIRWDAPTTRTDGAAIAGTVTYMVNIGANRYDTAETELRLNFADAGYEPGSYVIEVRAQEDFGGTGRVSEPTSIPFTLERIANPSPPTNLRVD